MMTFLSNKMSPKINFLSPSKTTTNKSKTIKKERRIKTKNFKQNIYTSIRLRVRMNVDKHSRSLVPYNTRKNTHSKRPLLTTVFLSPPQQQSQTLKTCQIISHNYTLTDTLKQTLKDQTRTKHNFDPKTKAKGNWIYWNSRAIMLRLCRRHSLQLIMAERRWWTMVEKLRDKSE